MKWLVLCLWLSQAASPELTRHYGRAVELQQAGRWGEAEAEYREALKLDAGHAPSWNNLGSVLLRQARYLEAAGCYERALALVPEVWQIHKNLGLAYLQASRFDDAASHLTRYLERAPGEAAAEYLLGVALLGGKKFEPAARHLEKARHDLPQDLGVLYSLAAAYANLGRPAEAEAILEEVFRTDRPERRLLLGEALEAEGPYDQALAELAAALAEKPDLRLARFYRGRIYWRMGLAKEAEEEFLAELKLNPFHAPSHFYLGAVLEHQERFPEALREYQEAARLDPGQPMVALHLGRVYLKLGDESEAETWLRRSISSGGVEAQAYILLGRLLASKGNRQEAARLMEEGKRLLNQQRPDIAGQAPEAAGTARPQPQR
ncbi:MAG: hypothetical protein Kow001_15630 [Acidobacteriota bacterium]